jgi:hypothetical protein
MIGAEGSRAIAAPRLPRGASPSVMRDEIRDNGEAAVSVTAGDE